MKRGTRNTLASLDGWSNERLSATTIMVAEAFAIGRLHGDQLALARQILRVYPEDPGEAKRLAWMKPRSEFGSSSDYFDWCQFLALFLKGTSGGTSAKRRNRATLAFHKAELRCKRVNKRLRYYGERPDREHPEYRMLLSRARGFISRVLGNLTEESLEEILTLSRPGGGSALGTPDRHCTSLPFKLGDHPLTVTASALPYAKRMVESSHQWVKLIVDKAGGRLSQVPYVNTEASRVSFVPKDSDTDRTIAVEPHLNMCLQLGVHEYIASRLSRFGVDIRSQKRNQEFALWGAQYWLSADPIVTLDLSAASDSVSIELVRRLLPSSWVGLLDDLRCPNYTLDKETRRFHKWSSMGNGYTFVLETLIFWGLTQACLTRVETLYSDCAVYGDDIALPRSAAALLIELLGYCGFAINRDKSFVFGEFRESCGEDYWCRTRVVPTYLRGIDRLRPTDMYRLVNRLRDRGLVIPELETLLFASHRGRPLLYGLQNNGDDGNCLRTDLRHLQRIKFSTYVPRYQAYRFRVAKFVPFEGRIPATWGFAASLLGKGMYSLPHWEDAKAAHRVRGTWSLVSCMGS